MSATATARVQGGVARDGLGRHDRGQTRCRCSGPCVLSGRSSSDEGDRSARPKLAPLYEDIGSRPWNPSFIWTLARIEAEVAAGMLQRRGSARHQSNVDELRAPGRAWHMRVAWLADASRPPICLCRTTVQPRTQPRSGRPTRSRLTSSPSSSVGACGRGCSRVPGGFRGRAETLAREAISIASLTDANRQRAVAPTSLLPTCSTRQGRRRFGARRAKVLLPSFLRQKGVKGSPGRGTPPFSTYEPGDTQPPPPVPPPPGIFRMAHLLSCAHGRAGPKRPSHDALTGG